MEKRSLFLTNSSHEQTHTCESFIRAEWEQKFTRKLQWKSLTCNSYCQKNAIAKVSSF